MNFSLQNSFVLNASSARASAVMIFLHGIGDNGATWADAFSQMKHEKVKYIFPNAPSLPISYHGGVKMPAWYDLRTKSRSDEDKEGIQLAAKALREFIHSQALETGLSSSQIFLGGFSMGACLALYTALTHEEPLGGVIALSSYLPLSKMFVEGTENHSLTKQTCEIFQGHGDSDKIVTLSPGSPFKETLDILKRGRSVMHESQQPVFKVYPGMGHEVCPQEMVDVKSSINKWMAAIEKHQSSSL